MKKIISLALITLLLAGCASNPKPKLFLGQDWYDNMRVAVEDLGIKCDAWNVQVPDDGIINSVTCSKDIIFFGGYAILNLEHEDEKGFMKSMADDAAAEFKRSSTYASNWMIVAPIPELEKIADAFHSTIVRSN